MKSVLNISFLLLVLAGCSNKDKVPGNIIQPIKMQNILWDMFQAQAWAQQTASKDSTTTVAIETKKLSEEVFAIHGITKEKYSTSYQWYLKHPAVMNKILDSISTQKSLTSPLLLDKPEMDEPKLLRPTLEK